MILNDRLAEHYAIPGVKGSIFRRVKIPVNSPRGGVLTQASVMKVTASGTDTSPILRGVWMLENIMGVHLPPPPSVPAIEPDNRGAVTIRDQINKHTEVKSCTGCHSKIDPVGFAFENFDPVGYWRDYYRTIGSTGKRVHLDSFKRRVSYRVGPDVSAGGSMVNGQKFNGIQEFKQILLQDKLRIAYGLTERLATYAVGRSLGFSDRQALQMISQSLEQKKYGLRSLIHAIIQSEIFLKP